MNTTVMSAIQRSWWQNIPLTFAIACADWKTEIAAQPEPEDGFSIGCSWKHVTVPEIRQVFCMDRIVLSP
jgi:hypothetical protein